MVSVCVYVGIKQMSKFTELQKTRFSSQCGRNTEVKSVRLSKSHVFLCFVCNMNLYFIYFKNVIS